MTGLVKYFRFASVQAFVQPVVVLSAALIAVIWLAVWGLVKTEQVALQRSSAQNLANLATVFDQNVARWIGEVDRMLLFLREAHERDRVGGAGGWATLIRGRGTSDEQTLQISVTDANGLVIANSATGIVSEKIDLRDREHFKVHAQSHVDSLFVSRPVLGRISKKWAIQVSRRYLDENGYFAGTVIVSLDPSSLARLYGDIDLGDGGGLALIGDDDVIRAGTGRFEAEIGLAMRQDAIPVTPFEAASTADISVDNRPGHLRLVAQRHLQSYPLSVIVAGRDLALDKSWQGRTQNYITGSALLSLIILVATGAAIYSTRSHSNQVNFMAKHDVLTGLTNRAGFREGLVEAFASLESGQGFALHLLDLDRFKLINDTYGHPIGDRLLTQVAMRLRGNVRPFDLVARLGGDEFAVIQTSITEPAQAEAMANRLCTVISEIYQIDGLCLDIGASVGIAMAPNDGLTSVELMNAADLALYSAKADGRDCYRFFKKSMDEATKERRAIEADLKLSIERNELELHYQPIHTLADGKVAAYEALLRWRHPTRGLVPPLDFIPVAEETGLIIPIGNWVLERACCDIAEIGGDIRVTVNVSPIQFRCPDLIDQIKKALLMSGLKPSRLEIEITESTLMKRDSGTLKSLDDLKSLGVMIAIDDFGTGYSSLSYLHTYPVSCIKIDRSFVMMLGDTANSSAIVRAIAALAASLGMSTIAEGVESQAQLDELRDIGCTEVQGYLLGKPKPFAQIRPKSRAA